MPTDFAVSGLLADRWDWWGAAGGPFGEPTGAQEDTGEPGGVRQRFERGEIAWSPSAGMVTSVFVLRNEACLEWSRPSTSFDAFRYDVFCDGVSQGHDVAAISFNDVHPEDELLLWTRLQGLGEYAFVVRSCDGDDCGGWTIPVRVSLARLGDSPFRDDPPVLGTIADRWHELGAWDGPLGRPVDEAAFDALAQGMRQGFQHGWIQTVPQLGARMVVAGYERALSPTDSTDYAHPSIELNWGGSDADFTTFRVDVLNHGQLTEGAAFGVPLTEWARSAVGSGLFQLRAPTGRGIFQFNVYAATGSPILAGFGDVTFGPDPTFRVVVDLLGNDQPFIPLEVPALDGSPAAAFASHRDRALAVTTAFAEHRPLRVTFRGPFRMDAPASGEDDGVRLMAHLAAADEDPAYHVPGELPSLVLFHVALRQLRLGAIGTKVDPDVYGPATIHRAGDYDTLLRALMVIAYRYRQLLTDSELGFILHRLVPPGLSDGHNANIRVDQVDIEVDVDPLAEVAADTVLVLSLPFGGLALVPGVVGAVHLTLDGLKDYAKDLPESENHILMIEGERYLINQLLLDRTGDNRYDNRHNLLTDWLTGYLQTIAKFDFMEFNARAYTRYSIHALLNLQEFARDEEVRTLAHNILDYTTAKFAVSSNRIRRVTPYRRLVENRNRVPYSEKDAQGVLQVHKEYDDLFSEKLDPMTWFFLAWTGHRDRFGRPLPDFPEWLSYWCVLVGRSPYRPPPHAYNLAMTTNPPALHTFSHGARPTVPGSDEAARGGVEIYSASPSFLISAGGMFLNSGYGNDAWHLKDVAIAQSTTLIPTLAEPKYHELIRFDPYPDMFRGQNVGVHLGFACGANLQIPDVWYHVTASAPQGPWTFLNLNADLGQLHAGEPDPDGELAGEEALGPLGFYVAAYRTAPAPSSAPSGDDPPPDSLGMLYAMEAGPAANPVMAFDAFVAATTSRNQLPLQLEYGHEYDFHTADDHTFTCRLAPTGTPYAAQVLHVDGVALPGDLSQGPLVGGRWMNAPGLHDGRVVVEAPGCEVALVLDSRDKQHPTRTDADLACAQVRVDRGRAIMALAETHRSRSSHVASPSDSLREARAAKELLDSFAPPDPILAGYRTLIARALHDLAVRLLAVGRTDDGIASARAALAAYRLAATSDGAPLAGIAGDLTELARVFGSLGLSADSFDATELAVELLSRAVSGEDANAVDQRALADAQHTLALRLVETGQDEKAASTAEAAIHSYHVAAGLPDADLHGIVRQLTELGTEMSHHSLTAPAADAYLAGVNLWRSALPPDPSSVEQLTEFADALHNLTLRLAESARSVEATTAAEEAIRTYLQAGMLPGAMSDAIVAELLTLARELTAHELSAPAAHALAAAHTLQPA